MTALEAFSFKSAFNQVLGGLWGTRIDALTGIAWISFRVRRFAKRALYKGLGCFSLRVFWWDQGGNSIVIHSSKESYMKSSQFVQDRMPSHTTPLSMI